MLLAIPGDNTFSNYQEAQRAFWRQTVLPLLNRVAAAISNWLSPAYGATLTLRPDLDQIEALSPERDALWTRIDKATFLTNDEKRAAAGYGKNGEADSAEKFNANHDDRGRFDFAPDGSQRLAQAKPPANPPKQPAKTNPPVYRNRKAGQSGADAATDVPSWARGERPFVGEDGKAFAKRLLDQKYGPGNYDTGPSSEFSKIQKFGDRGFD